MLSMQNAKRLSEEREREEMPHKTRESANVPEKRERAEKSILILDRQSLLFTMNILNLSIHFHCLFSYLTFCLSNEHNIFIFISFNRTGILSKG